MVRPVLTYGSAVMLTLWLTGCAANQTHAPAPVVTASYTDSSTQVLADANERIWDAACSLSRPESRCGMLVHADWRHELNQACQERDDLTACASSWFSDTERALEARYGSTTSKALATCGPDCQNPFFLELEMMRAYNQRIAAQVRESLRRAHTETGRGLHDDALHRQLLGSLDTTMAAPRTCSNSAECPFDSTCRLDSGNVNRGYCARF